MEATHSTLFPESSKLISIHERFRSHKRALIVLAVIGLLYGFSRLPTLSGEEKAALAARFRFSPLPLAAPLGKNLRQVRQVHPSMEHISAWISAVGASVALSDLDGDGLPNDVCHVEPRTDEVIVASAPGTPARYAPFTLDPASLPYDPQTMAPMGCLPGDLNEDGLMDLLVYYWGRTPVAMLRKQGAEHSALTRAEFVPVEIVPQGSPPARWYTNAATLADINGDGHLDLIIGNYFQDGARILDASAGGIEVMQHSMSAAQNAGRNRLLFWDGASAGEAPMVRFREFESAFPDEFAHGWTLAVGAADLDGDLLPELYVANDFGPDLLLHNRSRPDEPSLVPLYGARGLTTPKSKVLGRDSFKGMGVDFADINGDGYLDIYVSNIAAPYALEESHFVWSSTGDIEAMASGRAPYEDASEPLGLSRSDWSWDARFADFDNDGVPEAVQATGFARGETNRWPELQELATGNDELLAKLRMWPRFQPGDDLSGHVHNPFFVHHPESGRYFDIADALGLAQPMVTRGIAIADVDGDGDLDFAVANQWEDSYLYLNEAPAPGAFLGLHLLLPVQGVTSDFQVRPGHPATDMRGRPAVGAFVEVRTRDGKLRVAHVDGGSGHSGKRSPEVHLGLGDMPADTALDVTLCWRSSTGALKKRTLVLTPGWHTVLLGETRAALTNEPAVEKPI
ncbi:CRTAC1 family protein [Haliangium ochraceum]|uniref:CRTAC1 family protein n=1 Tax=Haliangium ochraceum TaxID=80816 RepID=UPI0005D468D2